MGDDAERGDAAWISMAAELLPKLSASPRSSRKGLLEDAARTWGRSPQTLQRMCKALEYLRTHRERSGLTEEQVSASVAAVEVLARIERAHPARAEELWSPTLLGKFGFRELLARERALPKRGEAVRADSDRWRVFFQEVVFDLFPKGRVSALFALDKAGYSSTGRMLRVDWEAQVESMGHVAVFLSPRIAFSAYRGRSVSDQYPMALAATHYYDLVVFLAWDEVEASLVRRLRSEARHVDGFRVEAFMASSTGRAIGHEFRA